MDHLSHAQQEYLAQLISGLRPGQDQLAQWRGGKMAIAAVPGSGKSHALAIAAVLTLAREQLHPQRQLVIVTFTRSAASSIKQKIRDHLKNAHLPAMGFSVHTLHGLALQIASRHPDISGLNLDNVTLTHTHANHPLLRDSVEAWIQSNRSLYLELLAGAREDTEQTEQLRRQFALRTEILPKLAQTTIHEAKSSNLQPEDLVTFGENSTDRYDLLTIAAGLYGQYQRLMTEGNLIDYDDMILGALRVLEHDELQRIWQTQIYGVFEDEAQDSSPLQEKLITLLATDAQTGDTNLVRVGDPNQAINSTFTPADPFYFNRFCESVALASIAQAGRSSPPIIHAANTLLHWMGQRSSTDRFAVRVQDILPVAEADPQADANPQPSGGGVEMLLPDDIYQTVEAIAQRLKRLLSDNPTHNAAILVREKRQGKFLADILSETFHHSSIQVYEAREGANYSHIPQEIYQLLQFLDRPHSPDFLKGALTVLCDRQRIPHQDLNPLVTYPERFLYPTPIDPPQKPVVLEARNYCCRLLRARWELPHYQLIPFLGMALQYRGAELATVQKLSERIAQQTAGSNKTLPKTLSILEALIRDERFEGATEDADDIYTKANQVTILTMHKAKGLDWDYVFLPFLHDNVIPGSAWVPASAQFLGDFSLPDVARAQIRRLVHQQERAQPLEPFPDSGAAWQEAQILKEEEEYRLLYVAMTRAKRLLWMSAAKQAPFSWSTFKAQHHDLQAQAPCKIFEILQNQFTSD